MRAKKNQSIIEENPKSDRTPVPEIIFEDKNYLVINKPAALAVHGGGNIKGETLVDWLLRHYPKIKDVGEDATRPGIVHRLDMDVSGLMVIAKNNKSFADLKNKFKERKVQKEYLALVHGRVSKDDDIIDFPIVRSKDGHKMAALPRNTEELLIRHNPKNRDKGNIGGFFKARTALTEFSVVKRFVNYTLLQVKIKTGRTHQIRVHLFAYGHPLAGDNLYYTKKSALKNKKIALGRVFLVANHLAFTDLEGKPHKFSLALPPELLEKLPKN
jgi:23S rRNA pseudouridine1911/1915/1917 synthase